MTKRSSEIYTFLTILFLENHDFDFWDSRFLISSNQTTFSNKVILDVMVWPHTRKPEDCLVRKLYASCNHRKWRSTTRRDDVCDLAWLFLGLEPAELSLRDSSHISKWQIVFWKILHFLPTRSQLDENKQNILLRTIREERRGFPKDMKSTKDWKIVKWIHGILMARRLQNDKIPKSVVISLRWESPSGKWAKLHTVAANKNIKHPARSLYYRLFAPHIYGCYSSRTSRSWQIAYSTQRQARGCNNINKWS